MMNGELDQVFETVAQADMNQHLRGKIKENGGAVVAHAHLDRAWTMKPEWLDLASSATVQQKWGIVDEIKREGTVESIRDRMCYQIESFIDQGVSVVSTFIDYDSVVGDKAMNAAFQARDRYKSDVQIVLMNQTLKGLIDPEERRMFEEASRIVDVIGCLPEKDKKNGEYDLRGEHLNVVFDVAKREGKMVHAHVDQNNRPQERETELLLDAIDAHPEMKGKVVAIHGLSVAAEPKDYREAIYRRSADSGLIFVSCPVAWSDDRRSETLAPIHNPITPWDEMKKFGVRVAVGTDNIADIYCPWNRGDMMEEMRTLARSTRTNDISGLVEVATTNGRMSLGLPEYASPRRNGHIPSIRQIS
jgi:cytosine deaminase